MRSIKAFTKKYVFIYIIFNLFILSLSGEKAENKNLSQAISFTNPLTLEEFDPVFHFPPVNQDETRICWSFSTLSFIESEMHRLGKDSVKLSVNYPMYYAFIVKAKHFVHSKGKSLFSAGDLFGTVIDMIKKYGIVPDKSFTGKLLKEKKYDHKNLYKELNSYIAKVKKESLWNEKKVVSAVKKILNKHIGMPPKTFFYKNKKYTPLEFSKKIVNLKWNDYLKITSFKYSPFFQYTSLNVPDNWLPDSSFVNVPLDLFYESLRDALKKKYSIAIDADFTEPGIIGKSDICFIPEYDIPSNAISQDAREYRFKNKLTTDDHLMHIVGYKNKERKDWFLVKDSSQYAFDGKYKGYFFFSDDFIKLKVLAYLIHKDAVPEIIKRLKK